MGKISPALIEALLEAIAGGARGAKDLPDALRKRFQRDGSNLDALIKQLNEDQVNPNSNKGQLPSYQRGKETREQYQQRLRQHQKHNTTKHTIKKIREETKSTQQISRDPVLYFLDNLLGDGSKMPAGTSIDSAASKLTGNRVISIDKPIYLGRNNTPTTDINQAYDKKPIALPGARYVEIGNSTSRAGLASIPLINEASIVTATSRSKWLNLEEYYNYAESADKIYKGLKDKGALPNRLSTNTGGNRKDTINALINQALLLKDVLSTLDPKGAAKLAAAQPGMAKNALSQTIFENRRFIERMTPVILQGDKMDSPNFFNAIKDYYGGRVPNELSDLFNPLRMESYQRLSGRVKPRYSIDELVNDYSYQDAAYLTETAKIRFGNEANVPGREELDQAFGVSLPQSARTRKIATAVSSIGALGLLTTAHGPRDEQFNGSYTQAGRKLVNAINQSNLTDREKKAAAQEVYAYEIRGEELPDFNSFYNRYDGTDEQFRYDHTQSSSFIEKRAAEALGIYEENSNWRSKLAQHPQGDEAIAAVKAQFPPQFRDNDSPYGLQYLGGPPAKPGEAGMTYGQRNFPDSLGAKDNQLEQTQQAYRDLRPLDSLRNQVRNGPSIARERVTQPQRDVVTPQAFSELRNQIHSANTWKPGAAQKQQWEQQRQERIQGMNTEARARQQEMNEAYRAETGMSFEEFYSDPTNYYGPAPEMERPSRPSVLDNLRSQVQSRRIAQQPVRPVPVTPETGVETQQLQRDVVTPQGQIDVDFSSRESVNAAYDQARETMSTEDAEAYGLELHKRFFNK